MHRRYSLSVMLVSDTKAAVYIPRRIWPMVSAEPVENVNRNLLQSTISCMYYGAPILRAI